MISINHLGDITKISGYDIEPVDCITAGSPCQDLSVAGKRAGLAGERSGLFLEQMRIIKEMRKADEARGRAGEFIRPRYMLWENVPGAFSSNGGDDFRCVLEETARIVEKDAVIPGPPKGGRWSNGGCIVGNGWSLAWKLHDAQFWGVAQRRKRIALVADFGGYTAPEILFVPKGVFGNIEPGEETGQGVAKNPEDGVGEAISFQERAGKPGGGKGILIQNERVGALSTLNNQSVCYGADVYNQEISEEIAGTVTAAVGGTNTSGLKVMVLNDQGGSQMSVTQDQTATLRSEEHGHQPLVLEPEIDSRDGGNIYEGISGTLRANPGDNQMTVVAIEGNGSRPSHCGDGYKEGDTMYTLNSTE